MLTLLTLLMSRLGIVGRAILSVPPGLPCATAGADVAAGAVAAGAAVPEEAAGTVVVAEATGADVAAGAVATGADVTAGPVAAAGWQAVTSSITIRNRVATTG